MYVHMYYRGPRGGARSAEYFDQLTRAKLESVDEDGCVLRVSTQDGYIHLSMGAEELLALARAFAQQADRGDKRCRRKPPIVPAASSSPVKSVAPLSAWDRLLNGDPLSQTEVQQ